MTTVTWLLGALGVLGGFDTLWFHEWRARLPARADMRDELRLHAVRSVIYALLFATLPWIAWHGWWTALLAALLGAEILITLADFVVEDRVRRPLGGLFRGERITHAIMGIVYGAMLAHLAPVLADWARRPSALVVAPAGEPMARGVLALMAAGVFLSGVRDLLAGLGVSAAAWPWRATASSPEPGGAGPEAASPCTRSSTAASPARR